MLTLVLRRIDSFLLTSYKGHLLTTSSFFWRARDSLLHTFLLSLFFFTKRRQLTDCSINEVLHSIFQEQQRIPNTDTEYVATSLLISSTYFGVKWSRGMGFFFVSKDNVFIFLIVELLFRICFQNDLQLEQNWGPQMRKIMKYFKIWTIANILFDVIHLK